MSMEGISLLPLSVVLYLVPLHPFVSFFLFVCGSFIYFSLLITLLYLSWLTLCSFMITHVLLYSCFTFVSIPFLPVIPPALPINSKPLFLLFQWQFSNPIFDDSFLWRSYSGEQRKFFYLPKTTGEYPKEFCLASLFKKLEIRGSRKRDADGKFWEYVAKGIF